MKSPALLCLLLMAASAPAKPLQVPNDAWRASALKDLSPLLRACLPKAGDTALARLPRAGGKLDDLDTQLVLQEPPQLGQGFWYRLGYRAKDGTVFVVALRSPDGQRTVFGPVGGNWTCLPADVRKELQP